ncbi:MAG: autotransporter-associated beta strand repeat-containing protein [Planctomycetota bacterium]
MLSSQNAVRLSTAALVAALAVPASALELTWDGSTGSPDWNAADGIPGGGSDSNWQGGNGGVIPDANDSVVFSDVANAFRRTINLNGDRSVLSATFDSATLANGETSLNYVLDTTPSVNRLTLVNGDLTVLDGNALINSDVGLGSSGTWDIANSSTVTLEGLLFGSASNSLTKAGEGTLSLSSGASANVLTVDDGLVITTGGPYLINRLAGDGTLRNTGGAIGLSGGGSIGRLEISGSSSVSTAGSLSANILTGSGTLSLSGGSTFTFGFGNGSSTFAGTISGNGSLIKDAFGVLTLSGSNTYTGTTTVNGGILVLEGGNAIDDAGAVIVNDRLSINADETIQSLSGLGQVGLGDGALTLSDSADRTFGGFFIGSNDLTLSGSGALTLTGASSSTGTFNINGTSTLRLANSFGTTLADSADVTIGTDGTLALDIDETIGGLSGTGNVDLGASTLTVTEAGGYDGLVTGSGGLTFDLGSGNSFTLSSEINTRENTYTGPTTITSGGLTITGGRAIGDESAVTVDGILTVTGSETVGSIAGSGQIVMTGPLDHGGNNDSTTFSGTLTGNGSFEKEGDGTIRITGDNAAAGYAGAFVVSGGVASIPSQSNLGNGNASVESFGTLNFENDLTLTNFLNVSNATLSTSADNNITLNNEVFQLTGLAGFGDAVSSPTFLLEPDSVNLINAYGIGVRDNATLIFGNSEAATTGTRRAIIEGTLDLNGFDTTLGQLEAEPSGVVTSNSGDATLTITGNLEFAGSITDGTNGVIDVIVDVANDTRNFMLSGSNTYSGSTTVDGTTGPDFSVLSVRGPNAAITNTQSLSVTGSGAAMVVAEGASVTVIDNIGISGDANLNVTGTGTTFEAGNSIFVNGDIEGTLSVGNSAVFQIVPPTPDNRFFIGSADGSKGVVNVSSGATLEFLADGASPFRTFVGTQFDTAVGEFNIGSGGQVTLGRTDVGNDSTGNGATGVINVDGIGTTLTIVQAVAGESTGNGAGDLILGSGGNGTLNITGGATVNVFDDIFVALGDDSTGELNVLDGTLDIGDGLFIGYNNTGPLTVGVGAEITANRFVVTNSDANPNITPGDAVVTFELSKDTSGGLLNGLIDVSDFSFRSGTRELVLDLDTSVRYDIGDTFVLVDYETLGGNLGGAVTTQTFDNVDDDGFVLFDDVFFRIDYDDPDLAGTALTATVIEAQFAFGDYDNSGQVEQGDLNLVLTNWGIDTDVAGVPQGWINDLPDGVIDQEELNRALTNWGSTVAPSFVGFAVPEPAVGATALLAFSTLIRRRRTA